MANPHSELENAIFDIAFEYTKGRASSRSEAERLIQEADPSNTPIEGMHYYSDTEPFARVYHTEIVELIESVHGEKIPSDLLLQNTQAWFAWGAILPRITEKLLDALADRGDFVDDVEDDESNLPPT